MQRARIRRYVLVGLVVLAAASMFPSFGGGSKSKPSTVPAERARFEAAARSWHPHVSLPGGLPPRDTWAER
jgi:hypothetical protein